MSLNPQAPKKPDDFAFALLSFPFDTLEAIGSRIASAASAFTSKSKQQPKESESAQVVERMPDITANQQYMIADRVYRTEVRGHNVSFYQYHAAKIIRITCRELRHLKPIDFTPAIAEGAALVYDIDGAIQWVRQNGLESNAAKRAAAPSAAPRASKEAVKTAESKDDLVHAKPAVSAAAAAPLNITPATGNKSMPFTGKIASFGVTEIKIEGRKPYSTYAMTLQSETGTYKKQFIGEHLADLVADHGLREGQLVRLQLLGKHHFEVTENGKVEQRSRNHYAIQTL